MNAAVSPLPTFGVPSPWGDQPRPVLFLHGGGNWMRGSENALLSAMSGFDRAQIHPFLICGNEALAKAALANGIEANALAMPEIMVDGTYVRLQVARWMLRVRKIASVIKRLNIQLLYCNGGSTCQVGYYAAKLAGIPIICHLHSPYNRRYLVGYRIHLANKVIFVSRSIRDRSLAKQQFGGTCRVVHNGVDTLRFAPAAVRDRSLRERWGIPRESLVFGQVSSLILRKGIDVLLRAFRLTSARLPHARLLIVGEGPDRAAFHTLAKELQLKDKVVFAGDHPDVTPFYRHIIDVNVLASRSDAFPLSLIEASSCGLSNIAADVDGIAESVLDGRTGLLFSAEDHLALAEAMSALGANRELSLRYGDAGRELVLQRFSRERYCEALQESILDQISNGRSLGPRP